MLISVNVSVERSLKDPAAIWTRREGPRTSERGLRELPAGRHGRASRSRRRRHLSDN